MTEKKSEQHTDFLAVGEKHLISLFGSKTRVKLLRLFLSSPETSFFVREITRLIDAQINSVRREIDNLIDIGIVEHNINRNVEEEISSLKNGRVQKKKGSGVDKKFYQLNKDFLLYPELQKLFTKIRTLNKFNFIDELRTIGDVDLLILGGAFVDDSKGAVDVFVVGTFDKLLFEKMMYELGKDFPQELNYCLMTLEEYQYRKNIVDKFVYSVIDNKKNKLIIGNI